MSSLKRHFSYQILAALGSLLFPLISFPYVAHTLGPSMLGKVNYVDFLAGLTLSLSMLGIPLFGTREIARNQADPGLRRAWLQKLLRLHLLAAAAGALLFLSLLLSHPRFNEEYGLAAWGLVYIFSNVLAAEWYLQGMEDFRFLSLRSIALRAAGLLALFLLVREQADYVTYYALIAATQLLTVILHFFRIRKGFTATDRKEKPPVVTVPYGTLLYFFVAAAFISIYDYTDTVMLGWLADDEQVGYYTASMKLVKMALLLILALNTILFPRLSGLLAEKKEQEAGSLLGRSVQFILLIGIPACALYILLAPELIGLFAGKAFAASIPVMRWLAPLPLFIALSNLFLLYYLARFSGNRRLLLFIVLALLINLGLNRLLIPDLREQGAAIASLCTESFILTVFLVFTPLSFPRRALLQAIAGCLFFIPIVLFLPLSALPLWMALLLKGGICGALYLALQWWVFRNVLIRSLPLFGRTGTQAGAD